MTKKQLAEIRARHAEQGEHGIDAQTMWDDLGTALAEIERGWAEIERLTAPVDVEAEAERVAREVVAPHLQPLWDDYEYKHWAKDAVRPLVTDRARLAREVERLTEAQAVKSHMAFGADTPRAPSAPGETREAMIRALNGMSLAHAALSEAWSRYDRTPRHAAPGEAWERLREAILVIVREEGTDPAEALYDDVRGFTNGGQLEEDHEGLIDAHRDRVNTLRRAFDDYRAAVDPRGVDTIAADPSAPVDRCDCKTDGVSGEEATGTGTCAVCRAGDDYFKRAAYGTLDGGDVDDMRTAEQAYQPTVEIEPRRIDDGSLGGYLESDDGPDETPTPAETREPIASAPGQIGPPAEVTDEELAEVERLDAEATEGPWTTDGGQIVETEHQIDPEADEGERADVCEVLHYGRDRGPFRTGTARFIAIARTLLPRLARAEQARRAAPTMTAERAREELAQKIRNLSDEQKTELAPVFAEALAMRTTPPRALTEAEARAWAARAYPQILHAGHRQNVIAALLLAASRGDVPPEVRPAVPLDLAALAATVPPDVMVAAREDARAEMAVTTGAPDGVPSIAGPAGLDIACKAGGGR